MQVKRLENKDCHGLTKNSLSCLMGILQFTASFIGLFWHNNVESWPVLILDTVSEQSELWMIGKISAPWILRTSQRREVHQKIKVFETDRYHDYHFLSFSIAMYPSSEEWNEDEHISTHIQGGGAMYSTWRAESNGMGQCWTAAAIWAGSMLDSRLGSYTQSYCRITEN